MHIEQVWFVIVALMLATYVVLDGFDLGVGVLHLLLARTEEERRLTIRSIGPVWNANEVWLLAAGGTLYFAFPGFYASSLSGFYIALMLVLWLLIFRATSIELRGHVQKEGWKRSWDRAFGISSLLMCVLLGVALGNVIRGVPIGSSGWFFSPLVTDFRVGPNPGLVDWYTVLVGLFVLSALLLHGSLWLYLKTEGVLEKRAATFARKCCWVVEAMFPVVAAASIYVQPQIQAHLVDRPSILGLGLVSLVFLMLTYWHLWMERPLGAFISSSLFLATMLGTVACSLYPTILPATLAANSLTVENVAAPKYGLQIGLYWWIPGMILTLSYFTYAYRKFAGKVRLEEGDGY